MQNYFQLSPDHPDYLETFKNDLDVKKILSEREHNQGKFNSDQVRAYQDWLGSLPKIGPIECDFSSAEVLLKCENLSKNKAETIESILRNFIPWKKGPWNLFDIQIDSEWRSNVKWERIEKKMSPLKGKRVADIGCNNGYFMFRMLAHNPDLVIGFEPYIKNFFMFNIIQNYVKAPELHFELLGVENLNLYPKFFDTIFCLGILYHHTDPVNILRKMYGALRKGGEIYIDCQGIPGEDPIALMPKKRYTNAKGFWWLPTKSCLENWLSRTQFREIEFFFEQPLKSDEQRSTAWSPHSSLIDFLDPTDNSKTLEGYPAPWRYYLKAKK